ncbi:hypothetical protein EIN_176830 [Entamoeba invadens IP1]|uniref:hypothetical protein n=1 Tax=Entamoeba invadens IP1 TaxID=370355 RepID=UPI0002C3E07A|nr:hypothetical protein EIN_176830 [Entamoeba invadens IP1]ELP93856.1 hypothetical protein EIN_176830 [Entamoeba invadens IP1]|eukprot:XP_004260627.1 hypothetical protein EIN_176830 [Entamoeba invadens IP1]
MNKGFLSKKSFHPGKLSNQKKVWEAEHRHEEELKKIETLKREHAEEVERVEEEKRNAEERGEAYVEKLNWMYDAPMGVDSGVIDESQTVQTQTPTCIIEQREIIKKVEHDPLYLTKRKEEAELTKVLRNTVKLREIEEKEIRRQVARFSHERNKLELEKIKSKIWITSERGKVGEEIIRDNAVLWSWWREQLRDERTSEIRKNN